MKHFYTQFKLIIAGIASGAALVIILSIGKNSAHATAWTPNGSTAPQNNTETLLHVGATDQEKGVSAPCTGAGTTCGLAVGAFLASQNAAFDGEVFFHQLISGKLSPGSLSPAVLSFGDAASAVTLSLAGNGSVKGGGLYSNKIVTATGSVPLCADSNGTIILCSGGSAPTPPTGGVLSGTVTYRCENNDAYPGVHLAFKFDKPVPQVMTLKLSYCQNWYGSGRQKTCSGMSIVPGGAPSGYVGVDGGSGYVAPWTITLLPGMSSYSVPVNPSCGTKSDSNNGWYDHIYMKLVQPSANWTVSMTGTAYSAVYARLGSIQVVQVP